MFVVLKLRLTQYYLDMDYNNLYNYQLVSTQHIIDHPFCGLFLDMGLGKTIATLTAIDYLIYSDLAVKSVLVVAPKRVAEIVWSDEIEKWEHVKHLRYVKVIGSPKKRITALKQKADIYIISRDNFVWLCAYYGGKFLPFDMVVFDELSSFKSAKSQRFKAARMIRPSLKRVVGLTGTPAPNGLIDLWPQMYLIDMGSRLEKTITRYREKYFKPGMTNGAVVYNYRLLQDSESLIHEKIKDVVISMKAEDYLDMPDKIFNFVKLKFDDKTQKQYDEFEKEAVLELQWQKAEDDFEEDPLYISAINAAALSNKLLQFANGAIYDEDKNFHEIHEVKLDALEELVEEADGKPMLVAYTYQHDYKRILKRLAKYNPRLLKTEQDIRDWNAGKIQVGVAHPASLGHGLNMQEGGHIITWFGLTWSLELFQQFIARVYRQGQKFPVIINILMIAKTMDEDVRKAIEFKDRKQGALMEAVKARIVKYKSLFK